MQVLIFALFACLFLASSFCLGSLIVYCTGYRPFPGNTGIRSAVTLMIGYATNLLVAMVSGSQLTTFFILLACLLAVVTFQFVLKKARIIYLPARNSMLIITTMFLLILVASLSQPIYRWDARSIWFLFSKLLYYNHGFAGIDWNNYVFAHPDYPKLLSHLGSQMTAMAGIWNEFVPKIAIPFLSLPFLFVLESMVRPRWLSPFVLVFLISFSAGHFYEGYLDAFVAFYSLMLCVSAGKYLDSKEEQHLILSIVLSGFLLLLKNESQLVIVALLTVLFLSGLAKLLINKKLKMGLPSLSMIVLTITAFAPAVAWKIFCLHEGIKNDLRLGTGKSFARAAERFANGDLEIINSQFLAGTGLLVFLFSGIGLCTFLLFRFRKNRWQLLLPYAAGLLICAGLIYVYLATPSNLNLHLGTSVNRVATTPIILFISPLLFLFSLPDKTDEMKSKTEEIS